MTLEFTLIGASFTLVRVLIREAACLDLECALENSDEAVIFKASGAQEVLSKFADKLTKEMPTSTRSSGFNVCQSDEARAQKCFLPPKPPVSPCPKCQRAVLDERSADFYNPYRSCFVCGHGVKKSAQNNEGLFADLALAISNGQAIRIKTINDDLVLSKTPLVGDFRIICRDLATLGEVAVISNDEILSLASIEKPRAQLALKPLFRNLEGVDRYFAECSLPFCMVEFLLLEKLSALGVSKVFAHTPSGEPLCADFSLGASVQERIMFLETKRALSLRHYSDDEPQPSGDDGIFLRFSTRAPNFLAYKIKTLANPEFISFNFNFRGFSGLFEMIKDRDENSAKLIENYKKNFSELYEDLSRTSCEALSLNFYGLLGLLALVLGYEEDSKEGLDKNSSPNPPSAQDLSKAKAKSKAMDLGGSTDPNKALNSSKATSSLNLEHISLAAEIFLNAADDFLGKKGPAIDFGLVKFEGKFFLDVVPVVKSAMSFKLAGVDRHVLAYGVIDSFAAFLSNNTDNLNTKNVYFLGAIFNHRAVLFKTASKFDKNYKII